MMISIIANAQTSIQIGATVNDTFLDRHLDYDVSVSPSLLITHDLDHGFGVEALFSNTKMKGDNQPTIRMFNTDFNVFWKPVDLFITPVFSAGFGPVWYSRQSTEELIERKKMTTVFNTKAGLEFNVNRFTARTMIYYRTATIEIDSFRTVGLVVSAGYRF